MNKDGGQEGGLNREVGLMNFPPLRRGGGAYLRGGLERIYGKRSC